MVYVSIFVENQWLLEKKLSLKYSMLDENKRKKANLLLASKARTCCKKIIILFPSSVKFPIILSE